MVLANSRLHPFFFFTVCGCEKGCGKPCPQWCSQYVTFSGDTKVQDSNAQVTNSNLPTMWQYMLCDMFSKSSEGHIKLNAARCAWTLFIATGAILNSATVGLFWTEQWCTVSQWTTAAWIHSFELQCTRYIDSCILYTHFMGPVHSSVHYMQNSLLTHWKSNLYLGVWLIYGSCEVFLLITFSLSLLCM